MVVENVFGRLKGRWRCLLKRMDGDLKNAPVIVAACVTLAKGLGIAAGRNGWRMKIVIIIHIMHSNALTANYHTQPHRLPQIYEMH